MEDADESVADLAHESVADLAQGGVVPDLAGAEFVVVGADSWVVQDRCAGEHVQGVHESVVVDEPGVDSLGTVAA